MFKLGKIFLGIWGSTHVPLVHKYSAKIYHIFCNEVNSPQYFVLFAFVCMIRVYTKPGLGHGAGHGPPYGPP